MTTTFTTHLDLMYSSSRDPELKLCTDVYIPSKPSPVLLMFHGWHGTRLSTRKIAELFAPHFVVVNVDMRGRGKSDGKPDVNGWELLDAVDAVRFVQCAFTDRISDHDQIYCFGASGGGGNVYALLGKYPDLFAAGVALCGISDYATWYIEDHVGEFRDDMDLWIAKHPDDAPGRYRSSSGIHLVENLLTPLLVYHGDADPRVPVHMGRRYANRATELKKPVTYIELEGVGHSIDKKSILDDIIAFYKSHTAPPTLPGNGQLKVGGYVQTRAQRIELASLGEFATLNYTLGRDGRISEWSMHPRTTSTRFVPV